jgi:quinolinate synthase
VDEVIFVPDRYLARYVASQTDVEIVFWEGACEVHERFSGEELRGYREGYPGVHLIAHPECRPDVLEEADFVGSTSAMIEYVGEVRPSRIVMVTECSMSDNVAVEFPEIEFIRPCNLCPHMKAITLSKIFEALRDLRHRVEIDPEIAARARRAIERMLAIGRRGSRGVNEHGPRIP